MDDASTGIDLIETIASSARTVTADAAYDTLAFYETANTRGTTVVVPPAKTAKLSRRNPRSSARDGTTSRISKLGRRRWKKEVGYHRQARVENAFFPVQVDSRRSTSKSDSRSASCRIGACVQRAQSNDRAWSTRVVRDRSVTNLRVGALGASVDLRNNARLRPEVAGRADNRSRAELTRIRIPARGSGQEYVLLTHRLLRPCPRDIIGAVVDLWYHCQRHTCQIVDSPRPWVAPCPSPAFRNQ